MAGMVTLRRNIKRLLLLFCGKEDLCCGDMPDDLYLYDALAWSEHQADLLARLARGERVNEPIDWPNILEEVRDVGLSELRAVRSLLTRALEHLLKLHAWPQSPHANHWRVEALHFLVEASADCTPSMQTRIDLADLYRRARIPHAALHMEGHPPARPTPEPCPLSLDDLLVPKSSAPDIDRLLTRLSGDLAGA